MDTLITKDFHNVLMEWHRKWVAKYREIKGLKQWEFNEKMFHERELTEADMDNVLPTELHSNFKPTEL